MPLQGFINTPSRNATVCGAAGIGRNADVEFIHGSKNSDTLKALIGTAYGRKAVWATVSTGGGMNDRVTYRTPRYGYGKNGAVPFDEITWSPTALNWGRHYGSTGFSAITLNKQTVIAYVTFRNMETKKIRSYPPCPPYNRYNRKSRTVVLAEEELLSRRLLAHRIPHTLAILSCRLRGCLSRCSVLPTTIITLRINNSITTRQNTYFSEWLGRCANEFHQLCSTSCHRSAQCRSGCNLFL